MTVIRSTRITFTVPRPIYEKLTELANLSDTSISSLTNRAVREWLEEHNKQFIAFYAKDKPATQERWR
jgi:predicted transcriptional regulator